MVTTSDDDPIDGAAFRMELISPQTGNPNATCAYGRSEVEEERGVA